MANFGFQPSVLDGTEYVFSAPAEEQKVPSKYSYKKFMPKVLDQGSEPICVPCSVSAYLNWRENLATGTKKDNNVDYHEIYNYKNCVGDGMTFKEAFTFLRHHGVDSSLGTLKIGHYALVRNVNALRTALIANGPCVAALPVYNYTSEFWKSRPGDYLQGYHAISVVGYDKEGFIIRNSWGSGFGSRGYTKIKLEEANKMIEIWTIMD